MAKNDPIETAIRAARQGEYLRALTLFHDVYGPDGGVSLNAPKATAGLSHFALCVALIQKKYKEAIELCRRATELEFYNGEHYANLARIYLAAGNRKKAFDTIEAGLKAAPEDAYLHQVHEEMGVRARPSVPFLDRTNPINVSLGQAKHAKKLRDKKGDED